MELFTLIIMLIFAFLMWKAWSDDSAERKQHTLKSFRNDISKILHEKPNVDDFHRRLGSLTDKELMDYLRKCNSILGFESPFHTAHAIVEEWNGRSFYDYLRSIADEIEASRVKPENR